MGSINLINGGLDVQSIVDNLIAAESVPITRMQRQESTFQSKITALQSFNTKLSALLTNVDKVAFNGDAPLFTAPYSFDDRFAGSIFSLRKAASSNDSIVSASASEGATSGSYSITVSSLAQAEAMGSANFTDPSTATGTGTLTLQVGSNSPVNITIDDTNNTLDGIRRAINAANAGVTATIINDGTPQTPYRLLLTSNETGTANAFTITDAGGAVGLGMVETAAAADARFTVNGVSLTKSTNTISDVIPGVTLNLKSTAAPASITVTDDIDSMVSAIQSMVSSYNDITSFVRSQFQYNSTTQTAGILSGDSTLRNIQSTLQTTLSQSVSNAFTALAVVSQVGMKFNNDGTISLDTEKLKDALTSNLRGTAALLLGDGIPPDSVTATDRRIVYVGKTSATMPGTYDIQVSTAARQAGVTGNQTVTSLSKNEVLTIRAGTNEAVISLLKADSLSTVISKINAGLAANGISASAADDGTGKIQITTTAYGSDQSITVTSNSPGGAGTTGFSTTPTSGTGVDVAGTINGHSAIGRGNILTGATGQAEEGLSLRITGSDTGPYGSVTVASSSGDTGASILMNLHASLKSLTDPLSGPIQSAVDGLNRNISRLDQQISDFQDRLERRRAMLTAEFERASEALQLMNIMQTSLTSQLASLSKIS